VTHPVVKHPQQIQHERSYRVFDDWLTLALAAYSGDEEAYMAIMKRYGPREPGKPTRRTTSPSRSARCARDDEIRQGRRSARPPRRNL